jgi:4-diphosphocytidyl-2-C-methyl-D-erythritol kinase
MPAGFADAVALAGWLRALDNGLEAPARSLCPAIDEVLAAVAAQPRCLLARMSGSGATCFGLFPAAEDAERAAAGLPAAWWRWGGAPA